MIGRATGVAGDNVRKCMILLACPGWRESCLAQYGKDGIRGIDETARGEFFHAAVKCDVGEVLSRPADDAMRAQRLLLYPSGISGHVLTL